MAKTPIQNNIKTSVELTHPERVYWPDDGVSKQDLLDYYALAWQRMQPFVTNRPLALLRCPDGIDGPKFFQKHAWKGINPHIEEIADPEDKDAAKLLKIEDFDGLAALVQSAALEIHPWGTTIRHWEKPDMIIMDLDPGEDVTWGKVTAAAKEIRERFSAQGLTSFIKTSGGKGLHVVASLTPQANWQQVKEAAETMAHSMSADSPQTYLSVASKAKRTGHIFVDYLRNGRGNTAVAPYSTRARKGAAVSMPIGWEELDGKIGPASFTIGNAASRLSRSSADPWADFFAAASPLKV
ncbi:MULTISPECIES: non-homologous end-joining DNA ligase [Rhizobium]|uniref:DNA ligase n=1 Tax=Rhizobium tropici TaxID=398 RepID=A0A329Y4H7_RHITR|nr:MULTISPECIES: non-homologous end-joining DNA ligase [Rhizobium]MBB3285473.1 bifunctional non-homologous end joining protein LigD [Rhizobium sp. BK252]MBB3400213.1 bifunctional non-homologous end joining protein LigD [Rhizobium sp. BK289]MBB3412792.1 bifunctional non-homologous end joining protein LigD [Rhizobium sp. BK284]MBB3480679.1 bifunctional non-homologous end joining protein LigD [Rhizobium sp. BK347]MDK4719337.1 non-homologous end-joining DNA ligase [Rhizobium sp. CNPSo 3968]